MSRSGDLSKEEILAQYYRAYYHSVLYKNACQSFGTRYFDARLEKSWRNLDYTPVKLLEIGFASGEHVSKVRNFPLEEYVGLDINDPSTKEYLDALTTDQQSKIKFIRSDAAKMPLEDNYFDRVVSTCLLHHVSNPLEVLREVRRVTKNQGEISIGLPSDPGLVNRLIKFLITYPNMRRNGVVNPKLIYALEHPNQIGGLLEIAKHVFIDDELRLIYSPLRMKSWNLNLMIVINVRVNK